VSRSSHAVLDPAPQRPDPLGLLEQQAVSRLPELVPIRYGRMVASPFAFFRGAAHVANFGLFASPERRLAR
jgi:hypothetical protein